jgi:hypothetical protein
MHLIRKDRLAKAYFLLLLLSRCAHPLVTKSICNFYHAPRSIQDFRNSIATSLSPTTRAEVSLVSLPREIKFSVFDDPDAGGSSGQLEPKPIIRLYYSAGGTKRITELTAGIEDFVKEYLARVSESLDQFKKYRAIQKRFRFVIWRK